MSVQGMKEAAKLILVRQERGIQKEWRILVETGANPRACARACTLTCSTRVRTCPRACVLQLFPSLSSETGRSVGTQQQQRRWRRRRHGD